MKVEIEDLWECPGTLCITTNGFVKNNGHAVMGAGVAKEAVQRIPEISLVLGRRLKQVGNNVMRVAGPDSTAPLPYRRNILAFPVKHNWWEKADPELIERSARQLADIMLLHIADDEYVFLPKPGCGNGGLQWPDVEAILDPVLGDYPNIIIVDKE